MHSHPTTTKTAQFHLPGLFEAFPFYERFLPLFVEHRDYFYDWCEIRSIYGAPADCIWNGGRVSDSNCDPEEVISFVNSYGITPRLTFSNSMLETTHLSDASCNRLCELFSKHTPRTGVIIHSELLLDYLMKTYPQFEFISSTTKVLTSFQDFREELQRDVFSYVVPDFRLNKQFEKLQTLSRAEKDKVEFLCNECCAFGCRDRKECYEAVSLQNLGKPTSFHCRAKDAANGYRFSKAMENPAFLSVEDIQQCYLPAGFSQFKIEGRGLGSAILLEFLLYYLTRPSCQLQVREAIYLDSMLDLF